ncbi:SH3 domain-containing protein [Clostridium minihomine]|uniref:SH3 domain-containing protein n=1 Tax=Clostridium minihomine TaxID=2045012 RepID=UPI000C78A47B|nr:SH3 domain-containing protein [Clostridium minihomine]
MNRAKPSLTKRIFSAMLSAAMITAVFVHSVPVAFAAAATATEKLNVRSGPGTTYQVVKTVEKGTAVETLDSGTSGWYKIKLSDGTQGYCSAQYLNVASSGSGSSSGSSSSSTYGTLTLDTRSYTMAPGNIYDFRAKVEGMGLTQKDVKVYSSRTGIATVAQVPGTDKYRVTGRSEGVCYIMAEVAGRHASIKITVQKGVKPAGESARSITLLGNHPDIPSGGNDTGGGNTGGGQTAAITLDTKSYQFTETGKVYQFLAKGIAKGSSPTATSSNSSVVSVTLKNANDARGYLYEIKSLAAGSATITISNGGASAQLPVTVSGSGGSSGGQTSAITLDTKSYQFTETGKVYQFLAAGIAKGSSPTATSSNSSVVSVTLKNANDARGYLYEIKSLAAGSATITISNGGVSAQLPVTVTTSGSGGSVPSEITGARTTTAVNLRAEPNTDCQKLTTLSSGVVVQVLDTSNSQWTKVKTPGGLVGYLFNDYIEFLYGNDNSQVSGLKLSHSSGTIPQGKSYYITATVQPSGSAVTWKSSNTNVATVSNGFIYGNQPGSAVITATAGSSTVSCNVTVTAAEPVKAAYTSPNITGVGQQVQLIAVTDNTRASVRFVVNMNNGTTKTVDVSNYTAENSTSTGLASNYTRVWKATMNFSTPGTYQVTAYSSTNGSNFSGTGASTSSFVVSSQDKKVSTTEKRRVSDEMLTLIGKWEGYSAAVYPDKLAYNIPTIGYGQTFGAGTLFYNNQTKTEAWAQLLNSVNGSYTQAVNTFITNNNIRANQQNFDAMVSFSYNVGAGNWNGTNAFDIRHILLNSVVPPTIPAGQSLSATATLNFDLYLTPNSSSGRLTEVAASSYLQVLQTSMDTSTKSYWYQVQTQDGTIGWARSGYIRFDNASSLQRDLNYTDANAIATEWLRWNQAGGQVYAGLVYRRLGETKVFSYGNYTEADSSHSNYKKNTYQFTYPISAKPYEQ